MPNCEEFLRRESGHIRPVGRRDHSGRDVGMDTRAARRCRLDHPPGGTVGHQGGQHRVVELVAAAHGPVGAEQRRAGEREVADRVERLVAHELVGEAQAVR